MELKVKHFINWERLIFEDRTILRSDLMYMSTDQVAAIDDLEVVLAEDCGKTLFIAN